MARKLAIIILILAIILGIVSVFVSWKKLKEIEKIPPPQAPSWIEVKGVGETLFLEIAPYEEPTRLYERWKVLRDYLSEKLKDAGWKVEIKVSKDYASCIRDVGIGTVDLAILPSVAFLEARRDYCVHPLAMPAFQGEKGVRCVLVARAEDPFSPHYIGKVSDIKKKNFAYADEKSLCGTLIAHKFMKENNIVWQGDLGKVAYLQNYDAILQAISSGAFDAGVVREPTFLDRNISGLKIVASSEKFPDLVFATNFDIDENLREIITKALEEMPENIVSQIDKGYTSFKRVEDQEFDSLRTLVKELHGFDYFLPAPDFCKKKPKCKLAPKK